MHQEKEKSRIFGLVELYTELLEDLDPKRQSPYSVIWEKKNRSSTHLKCDYRETTWSAHFSTKSTKFSAEKGFYISNLIEYLA